MTDSKPADDEPTRPGDSPPLGSEEARSGGASATAASVLETLRDIFDDVAERAAPTVKEYSARAAELTASAADKAAPMARKAGEATADASGKLADRSRAWASELRTAIGGTAAAGGASSTTPKRDAPSSDSPADGPEQPGL